MHAARAAALLALFTLLACKGDPAPGDKAKPKVAADAAVKARPSGPPDAAVDPRTGTGTGSGSAAAADAPDGGVEQVPPAPVEPRRMWIPRLETADDFLAYSKELGGERFTKFVIDLKTDAIYYFDVDVYRVHKDFVFAELYKKPRSKAADKVFGANYTRKKPEFLLCYLVHHLGSDQWTFAFWEGDTATKDHVAQAYRGMKKSFYLGDKVSYRPDSDHQEKIAKQLPEDVPVMTNDRLYKSAEYVAFNPGQAIGTLRIVETGVPFEDLTFNTDEVVILPESLPDITPVAGIMSETFSTPLAHVSLRARAWGIPNVGLKGATAKYGALVGKKVWFEATPSSHTLREATAEEIAVWNVRTGVVKEVVLPVANLDATGLADLHHLRAADATAYGAKAANLGEIVHGNPVGFVVPEGFGVPIHYYEAHLRAAGVDKKITELLADDKFRKDAAYRKKALEELRAAIMAAPLDTVLHQRLMDSIGKITNGDPEVGVFVRSSTNAEDLPGFNGAGLYDTVPNVKGGDALDVAMKQVWASVWNLRGYEEREFFRIDHTHVYGAVLVQVGVNATAAGVLVTAHPTDPTEKTTYTINAKSGLGMRVVEGKKVPEILLYDVSNNGLRVLSRSDEDTMLVFDGKGGVKEVPNKNKGKAVLTNDRARTLGKAARKIVKMFPTDRPLDIEWLFVGDDCFIVQARPYVVK